MSIVDTELQSEAVKFSKQLLARYGLPLLQSRYGTADQCAVTVNASMIRNGTTANEFRAVREWLLRGLQPFLEYPPALEAIVQLVNLVKTYPISAHTNSLRDAWYRMDTEYGQRYGKMWKGDTPFDLLIKERVWLTEFEKKEVSSSELLQAMEMIITSTLFRTYPPKLEEFMGAVLAVRHRGAPLIEEAWLMALSSHIRSDIHPLVKKARGMVGANDINLNPYASEKKFKKIYQGLLESVDDFAPESDAPEPISYLDKGAVLSIFGEKS